jgi:hypothetical protein
MNEKKYVMATIKIPLEITNSDIYQPLSQYIHVSFESIDELPKKQEDDFSNESIEKQILEFLNNISTYETNGDNIEPVENSLVVLKDELKNIKKFPKKNITFRNKSNSTSKYTLKLKTMGRVFDFDEPQEVLGLKQNICKIQTNSVMASIQGRNLSWDQLN